MLVLMPVMLSDAAPCFWCGSANPELAKELAARLGVPLTQCKLSLFNDGECNIQVPNPHRQFFSYLIPSVR